MQDINIHDILIVRKPQLKAYTRKQLFSRPELIGKVTGKLIVEAMAYIQGYADAIEKDIMLPVIVKDVQELLLQQGTNYIISKIDQ